MSHIEWLMTSTITRLVLAITSKDTGETLERWQFDVIKEDDPSSPTISSSATTTPSTSATGSAGVDSKGKGKVKTEKEVQGEIREIMKQITASVTFLPVLEEECELVCSIRGLEGSIGVAVGLHYGITLSASGPPAHIHHHLFSSSLTGSFTLLAYTSTADPLPIPEEWNDADPHLIDKGKVEQVRLRSFSTNVHKLEVSQEVEEMRCAVCFGSFVR